MTDQKQATGLRALPQSWQSLAKDEFAKYGGVAVLYPSETSQEVKHVDPNGPGMVPGRTVLVRCSMGGFYYDMLRKDAGGWFGAPRGVRKPLSVCPLRGCMVIKEGVP